MSDFEQRYYVKMGRFIKWYNEQSAISWYEAMKRHLEFLKRMAQRGSKNE